MSAPRQTGRRIDRRSLIGTGALASLLAAGGVAAGAATPRPGGILRMAVPGEAVLAGLLNDALGETLTEIGPSGVLRGGLARSWSSTADGSAWSFDLTGGAMFHDGVPLGASDVAEAIGVHTGPEGLLRDVVGIEAWDRDRVRLTLAAPDRNLPVRLADPELSVLRQGQRLLGTGAYCLDSESSDGCLRLSRVAADRSGQRPVWFDRLEVLHVAGPDERLDALLSGRVDLAADLDETARRAILRQRRLGLLSVSHPTPPRITLGAGATEEAVQFLARMPEATAAVPPCGQLTLSLSAGAAECGGTGALVRNLVRSAEAQGLSIAPGGEDSDLRISTSGGHASEAAMLIGHTVDLAHLCPPDARRIASRWFFT